MARRSQYPSRDWKIYANTSNFVPKPGDIAVWTYGSAGHTAIVIGPSDKSNFKCIDQNWYNANSYYGSKAAYVNHNYNGMGGSLYFVRPPYKKNLRIQSHLMTKAMFLQTDRNRKLKRTT